MTLAERLRSLADALPPAGSVTFTRADLLELAVTEDRPAEAPGSRRIAGEPPADLTVAAVAELFSRGLSTVRTWLSEGRFPNAYRLRGREWRIPAADITAMQRASAEKFREQRASLIQVSKSVAAPFDDLAAWRKHAGGAQ